MQLCLYARALYMTMYLCTCIHVLHTYTALCDLCKYMHVCVRCIYLCACVCTYAHVCILCTHTEHVCAYTRVPVWVCTLACTRMCNTCTD